MGIIDLVKGFFIAVFVLMLMSAVPMFIMSNSIKSTLLQPSFYQTQLESMNAYQKVQALLLDTASDAFPTDQLSTYGITKTELRTALAKQITKEWVKNESTRMINSLLWYMTDQTKGVNLSVSVRPKVSSALGSLVASKLDVAEPDAIALVDASLGNSIPDPFDLSTLMPGIKDGLKQAKSYIMMFMQISGMLVIAIVVLLVLIFLFTLDMVKFARTVGWPMLVAGVLLAITSFFMPGTVSDMLKQAMPSDSGLSVQTAIDFLRPLFNDILIQSIILIVISVLLVAFSFAYPMIGNGGKKKK
jgi:hypothetical protein